MNKRGPENPNVIKLSADLEKAARKNQAPIWKRVVELVRKPNRKTEAVNLYKIDKNSKEGETILVPAKVLSTGKLSKKITIAALDYSKAAQDAVAKNGSALISIRALAEKNPKGSKVRIII